MFPSLACKAPAHKHNDEKHFVTNGRNHNLMVLQNWRDEESWSCMLKFTRIAQFYDTVKIISRLDKIQIIRKKYL